MGRITCCLILFFSSFCFAQELETVQLSVPMPLEVQQELVIPADDPDIKDLKWNRWVTRNFVICSIVDTQGEYLQKNLETMKTWMLTRWGLPDVDFPQIKSPGGDGNDSICRLICVKDPALFNKLFKLNTTRVDLRDKDGKLELIVGFLLLDQAPSKVLPMPITEVCLSLFAQERNIKFGWWTYRGMGLLNSPVGDIRTNLSQVYPYLSADKTVYFSKGLLSLTEEEWNKVSPDDRKLYDVEAAMLCLMLRKEFGQRKFLWFLKDSQQDSQNALLRIYGFNDYDAFDVQFKRYMIDLSNGLLKLNPRVPETPDSYLSIDNPFRW